MDCKKGDGCISLEEFTSLLGNLDCEPTSERELKETFDFFDIDHDGIIIAEDLFTVFTSLDDEGLRIAGT